ncbi:cytochrome P450 [Bacillus paralicheniformis]|uniref:cytochrome P450 n=1 Tax=Bacillus paralicheniformis TaxID=1648923 RepID=UPI0021D33A09|nr:cytochrome P450 [Bacillus paralicheniformis]MCU4666851.1 cytochrome P450 [Bacillus paralicheniformis]
MTTELHEAGPRLKSDSDFWRDPYLFYDKLRSIHPVYKGTVLKHPGWYVTGYEEAAAILKEPAFINRVPLPEASTKYEQLQRLQRPQKTASFRPVIEEIVHELLDQLENKKMAEMVSEFAFPLASLIIADMLGVPAEERYQFRQWTADLIQTIDLTRTRKVLAKGGDTVAKLTAYFKDLIEKRKAHPSQDLISTFAGHEQLAEDEVLATCILLVIAGHETTVNLLTNGLFLLMNHPGQLSALKENPLLIESAVEECLRYESPTQLTARTASEDCEINGKIIKKGEHVYILLGAANRDPKIFQNPHVFDITRKPNPHLAFGAGAHVCLGSALARLEAQIAIPALLERLPKLKLASTDIPFRRLIGFRSLAELPVILN